MRHKMKDEATKNAQDKADTAATERDMSAEENFWTLD